MLVPLRPILTILLVIALVLPLSQAVLYLLGQLLAAMGDAAGERIVEGLIVTCLALWVLDLLLLLLALAIHALAPPDEPNRDE